MMSLICRFTFGGAVITSALLAGSAQIMRILVSCAAGVAPPPAPPAPAAAAATPDSCSLSFGASFSASA